MGKILDADKIAAQISESVANTNPAVVQALAVQLYAAWNEPWRHYHTIEHLSECLTGFESCQHLAQQPHAIVLALLFHDAVYQPTERDNEAKSAEWAVTALGQLDASRTLKAQVRELILATQHHRASDDIDTQLLLDIDLSVLGAEPERFAAYEHAVRLEYAFIPDAQFNRHRAQVMHQFAQRQPLFYSAFFNQRLAANAERNLSGYRLN